MRFQIQKETSYFTFISCLPEIWVVASTSVASLSLGFQFLPSILFLILFLKKKKNIGFYGFRGDFFIEWPHLWIINPWYETLRLEQVFPSFWEPPAQCCESQDIVKRMGRWVHPGLLHPGCEVAIRRPGLARGVYAEQNILLDCLNEESVHLCSISSNVRDKNTALRCVELANFLV